MLKRILVSTFAIAASVTIAIESAFSLSWRYSLPRARRGI